MLALPAARLHRSLTVAASYSRRVYAMHAAFCEGCPEVVPPLHALRPRSTTLPRCRLLPTLQGYLTGLGGNSLLLSYFAAKREMNAVVVQALGIASSFAVLTQIRAAGFMPRAVYAALAVVVGLQVRPAALLPAAPAVLGGGGSGRLMGAIWRLSRACPCCCQQGCYLCPAHTPALTPAPSSPPPHTALIVATRFSKSQPATPPPSTIHHPAT